MPVLRSLALAAAVALLTGCVWLRLLSWKEQLADFDRYFEPLEAEGSLVLRFREPCIRPADIGWLLGGSEPSAVLPQDAGGVRVQWRLVRPQRAGLPLIIELSARDAAAETLAESIRAPPELVSLVSAPRLLAMARAFGRARIDRERRSASAELDAAARAAPRPGRAGVIAAFGEPDDEAAGAGGRRILRYRYHLAMPDGGAGAASELEFELLDEALRALRVRTPRFHAWLEFAER
ncbi:MAG: hypothetical protein RMM29_07590 [Planctomycetota bacterium]|nr:hypothetical protein [Planctomycetota bacterium]MCX8039909.1 hypothetical protein [Planctomycetota bacterium]MDW8373491.1 hypothetical protein [Planctomycetota bacterium]